MQHTLSWLYLTAANREEALKIGRLLVEQRLVACINVIEGMTSVYWWEGRLQEDREAVLIAKTRQELVARVIAKVREQHSYACPCVVELPIQAGNPDYLQWLLQETRVEDTAHG